MARKIQGPTWVRWTAEFKHLLENGWVLPAIDIEFETRFGDKSSTAIATVHPGLGMEQARLRFLETQRRNNEPHTMGIGISRR